MNIHYDCPECHTTTSSDFDESSTALTCVHCNHVVKIPADSVKADELQKCLVCPSTDLFVRKDFPQGLGVTIVVIGMLLSSLAWYWYYLELTFAILFTTALIDLLLYIFVGDSISCYRCQAEYRGCEPTDIQKPFDLETHERYRQQAAREKQLSQ